MDPSSSLSSPSIKSPNGVVSKLIQLGLVLLVSFSVIRLNNNYADVTKKLERMESRYMLEEEDRKKLNQNTPSSEGAGIQQDLIASSLGELDSTLKQEEKNTVDFVEESDSNLKQEEKNTVDIVEEHTVDIVEELDSNLKQEEKNTVDFEVKDGENTTADVAVVVSKEALSTAEESVPALSEEKPTTAQANQTKYLVLHVGPPKTATKYLQELATSFVKKEFIQDNYKYDHGNKQEGRVTRALRHTCRWEVNNALKAKIAMPNCWKAMRDAFKEYGDRHIFLSNENLHFNEAYRQKEWWKAMKEITAEFNYKIIVIVAYRRLYEWLPSAFHERNLVESLHAKQWTGVNGKGKKLGTLYPRLMASNYINGTQGNTVSWFYWTPEHLRAVPSDVETRLFNLHEEGTVKTRFYCDMLPAAKHACEACKRMDTKHADTATHGSVPVAFDALAVAAADASLIDTKTYERQTIRQAAEMYNKNELNQTLADLSYHCPTDFELGAFLESSLYWEKAIVPDVHDEEAHKAGFWKAVAKKKFCSVDENATLASKEWKPFFARYAKSAVERK